MSILLSLVFRALATRNTLPEMYEMHSHICPCLQTRLRRWRLFLGNTSVTLTHLSVDEVYHTYKRIYHTSIFMSDCSELTFVLFTRITFRIKIIPLPHTTVNL